MKHLFSCLRSYKKEAILSPLFKLLEATMELIVPLIVAKIVDVGIAGGDRAYIVRMSLVLVAFGVAGLAFALTAQYFAAKAAVGVSSELRRRLFTKLQSYSYAQIDEMGASTMITRMTSDVNQVQTGVNMVLRIVLRSPFIVFGAIGMAFFVDVSSALVLAAVVPLLAVVIFAVMGACLPRYRRVQERLDSVYLTARENLSGVRVIRAFNREEDEIERFRRETEALKREQKRTGLIAAITNPLTYALVNLAVVALLYVGAFRVHSGALEQGDVLALYGYLAQILVELVKFANLIVTLVRTAACQRRISAALDSEGEPSVGAEEDLRPTENHVEFDDVTFSYGGAPVLEHVTLSAKRGETIGILGGTGAGKSTLVGLIPRFYSVEQGCVRVGGRNVESIPVGELRAMIGMVPQKAALFQGTIRSNLQWGKEDATDEELLRAVGLAQAAEVVEAKGGLDAEVAQEGRNFSGGQRQRLTIARALVRDPEILILDDSSSALDYATDKNLRRAISSLDCTVFVVSQRATSVMHADRILVLDDGKVVGLGVHGELMENCPVYREIYEMQTRGETA